MIIFDWILYVFAWIFFLSGIFIIFSCFIGIVRNEDFFIRVHAIKISNIYGISFVLISQGLNEKNILIFIQLLIIIILNIISTLVITNAICRIALNNNIVHGGFSRRKYNEILNEEEKKEQQKRAEERRKIMEENQKKAPVAK